MFFKDLSNDWLECKKISGLFHSLFKPFKYFEVMSLIYRNIFPRSKNCQIVGYAPRRRTSDFPERDSLVSDKEKPPTNKNGHGSSSGGLKTNSSKKLEKGSSPVNASSEDGNCIKALHSSVEHQQDHASDSRGRHIPLKVCFPITSQLWLFPALDFMVIGPRGSNMTNEFPWIYGWYFSFNHSNSISTFKCLKYCH